ncbi:MAG: sugar transferase [Candidatus Saccharimonadales bacterium]
MSEMVGAEWTLSPHKRSLDLLGMTALTPIFIPAGAAIASTIRSVDEVDPIFAHTRYGLQFEPFTMYKFRTMPPDTSPDSSSIGSRDGRRTELGTKLSVRHLDEMPQAVNIYNGTMSLVGPRPLMSESIERTLEVLSPAEQNEWIASRWVARPGVFGRTQISDHISHYEHSGSEEFIRAHAHADIEYAANASFRTDMEIVRDSARAALSTFVGREQDPEHLRGESGARMFRAVAEGFGIGVTDREHEWWRATLLAARCLDDIVDTQGVEDLRDQLTDLIRGETIDGMTSAEAGAFSEAFANEPNERQELLQKIYLSLPMFAARKRTASTSRESLRIAMQEANIFAEMLSLDPTDHNRKRFNSWLSSFSRAGYLADLVIDSNTDFDMGNTGVKVSPMQRTALGAQAVLGTGRLLAKTPSRSYGHLAIGAIRTLFL